MVIYLDIEKIRKKFPEGFPVNQLPEGAKEEAIEVYRICRSGAVEEKSFLPTYLDPDMAHTKENEGDSDIGHYSLSTWWKKSEACNMLKFFRGKNPEAIVAFGTTDPSCGLSQRTKERTGTKKSHVDWWLYEDAEPHTFFKAVDLSDVERGK